MTALDCEIWSIEQLLAKLQCPLCASKLDKEGSTLGCQGCNAHFSIEQGIIDFRTTDTHVSRAALSLTPQAIAGLSAETWVKTVCELMTGRSDLAEKLRELTSAGCAAWKGFLDLQDGGRFLVLCCGYGNLVQNLAPHLEQICALDEDDQKLRFAQRRLAIFHPENDVSWLLAEPNSRLPFKSGHFDGVIVADPSALRNRNLFVEIHRVLRDNGQLFMLADNRFSLSLPPGWWDRWTMEGQPKAAIGRAIGLINVWWRRRNGELSVLGLRRATKRAGFKNPRLLGLWPDRHQLDEIIPLSGLRSEWDPRPSSSWRRRLKRQAFFLPTIGLLAEAGGTARDSTYDRIFEQVARKLVGTGSHVPVRAVRTIITRKDKMIVLARRAGDRLVVRIPFGTAATAAEERNAASLSQLPSSQVGLGPKIMANGVVDGIAYRVESMMPGVPLRKVLKERGSGTMLAHVERFLEELNPSTDKHVETLEGERYKKLVDTRLERLFEFLPDDKHQKRVGAFFRSRLHGADFPFGLVHGDFSCSNIYFNGSKISGVIDWEAADFNDLPVLDAIGYLESVHRLYHPAHSIAQSFPALAGSVFQSSTEQSFLFDLYERMGIDPECHAGLVYLRWLRLVDYLLPYWLRYHSVGQKRYIHDVVCTMLEGT